MSGPLTQWRLAWRGLTYHRRAWVAVGVGVAVATAVLVAALVVGDGVRHALADLSRQRLGALTSAIVPRGRTLRSALARDIGAAAALQLDAVAARPDGRAMAAGVTLIGAEPALFEQWGTPAPPLSRAPGAHLGAPLAARLGVAAGDEVILRLAPPEAMPGDAPMSLDGSALTALRLEVASVLDDEAAGRFALVPHGPTPLNAFVDLGWLQDAVGLPGRANLLAASGVGAPTLQSRLREHWQLADAGLTVAVANGVATVEADRVIIEPSVVDAAPDEAEGVLTWFAREVTAGPASSPYAFIAAMERPPVPLPAGGVAINQWLADDLAAKVGDELSVSFWAFGPRRQLDPRSASFRITAIIPTTGAGADPSLTPAWPGFEGARSCRDWDPGVPVDLEVIRDVDEAWWTAHSGAPKAFINLAEGEALWASNWGTRTAFRLPADRADAWVSGLLAALAPEAVGLGAIPVAERAAATAVPSTDFAGLFVGFGFVLLGAALLLVAVLFALTGESRRVELQTLAAVGLGRRRAAAPLLREGMLVAALGAVLGAGLGVGLAWAVTVGLGSIWARAVAGLPLAFVVSPGSVLAGGVAGAIIGTSVMALSARRLTRDPARRARPGRFGEAGGALTWPGLAVANLTRHRGRSLAAIVLLALGTLLVVGVGSFRHDPAAAVSRGSGTGGFALYGELTTPIHVDLNSRAGLETLGLAPEDVPGASLVQVRLRAGDDASCLNLGQALQPRLLALDPDQMGSRGAFAGPETWSLLREDLGPDVVPVIGDEATVLWGLHLLTGGVVPFVDEAGDTFDAQIMAVLPTSMLQGALIMDERHFVKRFPSEAGDRVLLIDAPPEHAGTVAVALGDALADHGAAIVPAPAHLSRFLEVENTYLAIFLALGALGLCLGVLGVAALFARAVVERADELELLSALGWTRPAIRRLLLGEHLALVAAGLGAGALLALPVVVTAPRASPAFAALAAAAIVAVAGLWLASRRLR